MLFRSVHHLAAVSSFRKSAPALHGLIDSRRYVLNSRRGLRLVAESGASSNSGERVVTRSRYGHKSVSPPSLPFPEASSDRACCRRLWASRAGSLSTSRPLLPTRRGTWTNGREECGFDEVRKGDERDC